MTTNPKPRGALGSIDRSCANVKSVPMGNTRTPDEIPLPEKMFITQVAANVSVTGPRGQTGAVE